MSTILVADPSSSNGCFCRSESRIVQSSLVSGQWSTTIQSLSLFGEQLGQQHEVSFPSDRVITGSLLTGRANLLTHNTN